MRVCACAGRTVRSYRSLLYLGVSVASISTSRDSPLAVPRCAWAAPPRPVCRPVGHAVGESNRPGVRPTGVRALPAARPARGMARVEIAEVRHAPGLRGRAGDHVGVTAKYYMSFFTRPPRHGRTGRGTGTASPRPSRSTAPYNLIRTRLHSSARSMPVLRANSTSDRCSLSSAGRHLRTLRTQSSQ